MHDICSPLCYSPIGPTGLNLAWQSLEQGRNIGHFYLEIFARIQVQDEVQFSDLTELHTLSIILNSDCISSITMLNRKKTLTELLK